MAPDPGADLRPHDSSRRGPAGWALWRLPARLLGTVLLVEAVAAGLLVHGLVDGRTPTPEDARLALVLCLLAVAHTEVAVRVERARRHLTEAVTATSARSGRSRGRCCCQAPTPLSSRCSCWCTCGCAPGGPTYRRTARCSTLPPPCSPAS